jgi:hypothetical protein
MRVLFRWCVVLATVFTPVARAESLGINLTWVSDFSDTFVFVDAFKASRSWIAHRPSGDTWDTGEPFDLDENGWV